MRGTVLFFLEFEVEAGGRFSKKLFCIYLVWEIFFFSGKRRQGILIADACGKVLAKLVKQADIFLHASTRI